MHWACAFYEYPFSGQKCSDTVLSFAIILDGSSSISNITWAEEKVFVKRLITEIGISSLSKVTVIQYGTTARTEIACNAATTTLAYNALVDNIERYTQGLTGIKVGLDQAGVALSQDGCGGRTDEKKIIYLLTDGKENLNQLTLRVTSQAVITSGIMIYALGIGPDINLAQLQNDVTLNASRVMTVTSFSDLASYHVTKLYKSYIHLLY